MLVSGRWLIVKRAAAIAANSARVIGASWIEFALAVALHDAHMLSVETGSGCTTPAASIGVAADGGVCIAVSSVSKRRRWLLPQRHGQCRSEDERSVR